MLYLRGDEVAIWVFEFLEIKNIHEGIRRKDSASSTATVKCKG